MELSLPRKPKRKPYVTRHWSNQWRVFFPKTNDRYGCRVETHESWERAIDAVRSFYVHG